MVAAPTPRESAVPTNVVAKNFLSMHRSSHSFRAVARPTGRAVWTAMSCLRRDFRQLRHGLGDAHRFAASCASSDLSGGLVDSVHSGAHRASSDDLASCARSRFVTRAPQETLCALSALFAASGPLYSREHGGTTKEPGAVIIRAGRGLNMADDLATGGDQYLRPAEAAAVLHVSPQTVRRWASQGKIPFVRTAGGHRRFPRSKVQLLRQRLHAEAIPTGSPTEWPSP